VTSYRSIRDQAAEALRSAMKSGDRESVAALRILLGEFSNAEAVPAHEIAGPIELAAPLGLHERSRRELTEDDLLAIARREHAEVTRHLRCAEEVDDVDAAAGWGRRAEALGRLL
jgi:hypothetical protein